MLCEKRAVQNLLSGPALNHVTGREPFVLQASCSSETCIGVKNRHDVEGFFEKFSQYIHSVVLDGGMC